MKEKDIHALANEAILNVNREKGFDISLAEMLFGKGVGEEDIREVFDRVREVAKEKRPDLFIPGDRKAWRAELNAPKD